MRERGFDESTSINVWRCEIDGVIVDGHTRCAIGYQLVFDEREQPSQSELASTGATAR
jgi:hypothetical protein